VLRLERKELKKRMKVVLTALDSKFIHSNLAVRYLKAYTKELNYECVIKEFTVNDRIEKILEALINEKPDILAFSCYIWNIEYVKSLATLVKLVNPKVEILYGGPEVSYDSKSFLNENLGEYVIFGEGEETFYEFVQWQLEYRRFKEENINLTVEKYAELKQEFLNKLNTIKGLCFKTNEEVNENVHRELMNMDKIAFPYDEKDELENKIVYYEASRGCPFNCKYCLSSTTHGVRFLNLDRVKKELNFIVQKGSRLIKFVDRTFNCNAKFASEIWKFLIDLDTEATFHFEISADILTEDQIKLLEKAPIGRIQFEVGVQTTNDEVLKNINRHVNFEDIKEKVVELEKIKNIKQHLDLIAGLPGEDFASFKKSFNDVYSISPEEIQLGFLKLLKGSSMREEALKWGMVYSPYPPYEILSTKDISYDELMLLKKVEEVVDKYYNSRKFDNILKYFLNKFRTPFDFYYSLGMFFYNKGYLNRNISGADYYKVFIEFNKDVFKEQDDNLKELIKYEYLKFNRKKWIPEFLSREKNKEEEREIKEKIKKGEINVSHNAHIEKFYVNVEKFSNQGVLEKKNCYIIFDDENRKEIFYPII
jgi:Fe-S oxidoreductase